MEVRAGETHALPRNELLRVKEPSKRKSMADKASKQPLNVPGAWYVDMTCTMCRTCLEEAPNLLKTNEDETAVYFLKQPENDAETAAAQRAMEVCPTLAIGNDG
jgi:ferredoxin